MMLCFRNDFPISSQVTCTNGNTSAIKAHQLAAGDFLSHRPGQCDADADKMHFDIKVFARLRIPSKLLERVAALFALHPMDAALYQ